MKPLRDRLLDIATILVLVGAVGLYGFRYLEAKRNAPRTPEEQTKALLAAASDTLWGTLAGDTTKRVRIDFRNDTNTIVLLFSTSCPWCKKTKPQWESVADSLPSGWRLVAITVEPNSEDASRYFTSPRIQVIHAADVGEVRRQFPVSAVPVTLAVRSGKTLAEHVGYGDIPAIQLVVARLKNVK